MIKIITDSTSGLAQDFLAERNIKVVPLKVNFSDTESYDEITGISNEEFYRRLTTEKTIPFTSQPSAGEFKAAFEEVAQNPDDEILVLTLSGKLSGTIASAQTAKTMLPDLSITLFDSLSLALGLGFMVATASDMALAGKSMGEIVTRLEQMRRDMKIYFVVDTLEYLHKGGRIGGASAFLGSILNIKPILTIDNGLIEPFDKVRTKKKALARIVELLQESVPSVDHPVQLGVMHAAAFSEVPALETRAFSPFSNIERAIVTEIGPVLGTHGGPGLLGAGICPNPVE